MPDMNCVSGINTRAEQSPDRQPCLSERLAILLHLLLGRAPIRRLAQSLITILLLISPLSFSTDKVTNFTYECPVSSGCGIKETRRMIIQARLAKDALIACAHPGSRLAPPSPLHPPAVKICTSTHSRAPPSA
jgi:hypothetical protein